LLVQNINLPLSGDDAAIKKYASDVEALKKRIGMPDVEEVGLWCGSRQGRLSCSGLLFRLACTLAARF
jgi:hypothetical protein